MGWQDAPIVKPAQATQSWENAPIVKPADQATLSQALFPRATAAKGPLKTALGAGEDALTGILRVPAAAGAAAAAKAGLTSDTPSFGRVPVGTTFKGALDNLNQGKNEWGNPNVIAQMGQDPATVPTTVMPVAKIGKGATWLGRIAQTAFQGTQMAGASAMLHQVDNYVKDKGLDAVQAAKEIAAGTGVGALLGTFGEAGKALGAQITKSWLKPGYIGTREGVNVPAAMASGMGGSGKTMAAKAAAAVQDAGAGINAAIQKNADKTIEGGKLFTDLTSEVTQQIKNGEFGTNYKAAEQVLQDYADGLRKFSDPMTGKIPLPIANNLKREFQNEASRIYEAARVPNTSVSYQDMVKERISRALATKFQAAIEQAAPEIKAPNAAYAAARPMARAIARRNIISGQHNPIGLDELAAIDAGAQFINGGEMSGALLPFLVRALKSPMVGNAAYQGGGLLQRPGAMRTGLLTGNIVAGQQ